MTDLPPTSLLALPVTSAPTSTKETGLETETRLHSSTTKTKDHSVKPDLQLLPINSPFDSASDDEDYQLKEVPHAILTSPSANHLSDSSPNKPSSKMVKRIQPINVKRIPSKRQKTDIYTPKRLLQNEKTELANVDIKVNSVSDHDILYLLTAKKAILCDEEGWAKLSDDARAEIVSKIPNTLRHEMMIGDDGQPRPNLKFLEKNSTFKSFINQALNDVVNGLNEPNWLAQAYNAHCKRSYGKFDDFKDKNYEEFWGVKQRLASNAIAGTSAHHNLGEMIDREVVKPGDVFKYSRSFRNRSMVIKKEAEVGTYAFISRFAY